MSNNNDLKRVVQEADLEQIVRKEFNSLRGRLCGFIEACGLPDRQERGAIATLKTLSYEIENNLADLLKGD